MTKLRQVRDGDDIEITLKFKASLTETYVGHSSGVDGIYLGKNLDPSLYTLKIIPKPLAVGDAVRFGDKLIGTIAALADNVAWVKRTSGDHSTYYLKDLKKDNCNCD